jgi:peptidoglycan/LPS O-acetylase OafA/YrhL
MIVLLVVGGPLLVAFGHLPLREVVRDGLYALTQTTAFATAFGVKTQPSLAPMWSLTVEWVYYLVFPLVLLLLRRRLSKDASALRALIGITVGLFLGGLALPPLQYYLLPVANLSVLFAGGTLATWHHLAGPGRRTADEAWTATAALLLVILVFLPGHTLGWGWKAVVLPATTIATLVVLHGCWANSRVAGLLAARPLRYIGLRAYSVYLWHMPVMWLTWVNLPRSPSLLHAAVCVTLVAVVAGLSFRLLERPVLGMRVKRHEPRPNMVMGQERRKGPAAVGLLSEPGTPRSPEGP